MNLSQLDMNLLKLLSVLIEERSVTRTGVRLGRTQSAVSNALNRLRRLLGDELLVRGRGGLVLTQRAEALRQPLKEMMQLAEICLSESAAFDPARSDGVCRIAMPDRLGLPVLPPLVDRLRALAPGMSLHVITADRDQAVALLDDDRIDVALASPEDLPSHVRAETLFDDELVCLCRRGHPLLRGGAPFELKALLSFPHLVVSASGGRGAIFDSLLAQRGLSRRPLVSLSSFSAVPQLLERTDMIGVFARRIAGVFADGFALAIRPLPMRLAPLPHVMLWHARSDRDPMQTWLRGQIRDTCAAV